MDTPRRYLLCKSGYEVNILWMDAHGSCTHTDENGSLYFTRYHMKRDSERRVWCLLCPNGLEKGEWARVFVDDPPGSAVARYVAYKEEPPKKSMGYE